MRQYQPIWELLKRAKTATLVAPVVSHQRIIQAVRKERSKDLGWKLLASDAGTKYTLEIKYDIPEGASLGAIIFYLVPTLGITIKDL